MVVSYVPSYALLSQTSKLITVSCYVQMCPAKAAGLYALKPTVGLVPGKGVISISYVRL